MFSGFRNAEIGSEIEGGLKPFVLARCNTAAGFSALCALSIKPGQRQIVLALPY